MFKSVVKFTLVFVLIAALAAGAASSAFFVTRKIIESGDNNSKVGPQYHKNELKPVASDVQAEVQSSLPDYYTVRLEGETVCVYANFGDREDFMYNAEIYKSNLSSEDVQLLMSGVKLQNQTDLTSFMEDYTS